MPKLLVIADDLTGAADTGVQFAKKGVPVFVAPEIGNNLSDWINDFEVLVVNTESRHLAAVEAAERVRNIVGWARDAGIDYFYKKTDSTLRGNIGSELEALLHASGEGVLAFVPASPKLQRTTREGFQYVGERLLQESAFSKDPLDPIMDSYVPAIIARQTKVHTRVVTTSGINELETARFREEVICIFDGQTDNDLYQVGEFLKRRGMLKAVAGSAGFAEHLLSLLRLETSPRPAPASCPTRLLVVNGSLSEVSLNQVSGAERYGFATVTLPTKILMSEDAHASPECRQVIARIIKGDLQGRDVLLRSLAEGEDLQAGLELGEKLGLNSKQLHLRVAENIGKIVGSILEQAGFKLVAVFGGDTTASIARVLKWPGLLPVTEISPGITLSKVAGKGNQLLLITKAGGFGPENVLQQIKDFTINNSTRSIE